MAAVTISSGKLLNIKNEILQFATTWMGEEDIIPREIYQNEKDKYMCYNLHVESKKEQMNEYNKTDSRM